LSSTSPHPDPVSRYRLICSYGSFPGPTTAIIELLLHGGGIYGSTEFEKYRVTDFPDSTTLPLYVRGFFMPKDEIAVFVEAEAQPEMHGEIRYVIMVKRGKKWCFLGIFAGPATDGVGWARAGLEGLIKRYHQ